MSPAPRERYRLAIQLSDRALAVEPSDPGGKVYAIRAAAFVEQNKHADALRDYALSCDAGHQANCQFLARRR